MPRPRCRAPIHPRLAARSCRLCASHVPRASEANPRCPLAVSRPRFHPFISPSPSSIPTFLGNHSYRMVAASFFRYFHHVTDCVVSRFSLAHDPFLLSSRAGHVLRRDNIARALCIIEHGFMPTRQAMFYNFMKETQNVRASTLKRNPDHKVLRRLWRCRRGAVNHPSPRLN